MPDMLCSLVKLPPLRERLAALRAEGFTIRRPHPWERESLDAFIRQHFSATWAQEVSVTFAHQPVTSFVALKDNKEIVGFAAYEATRKDYFGPTGVAPDMQGKGIGAALFLASLRGLRELGYTYAIIGGAGPVDFYRRVVGAQPVPFDDKEGIYRIDEEPGLSE
jgi:predicted N-acetyltransferase YhbS